MYTKYCVLAIIIMHEVFVSIVYCYFVQLHILLSVCYRIDMTHCCIVAAYEFGVKTLAVESDLRLAACGDHMHIRCVRCSLIMRM